MADARELEIIKRLSKTYPDAECSLTFKNPFQLMIATVLSAQCTDARVNKVTPELFKKYADPDSMKNVSQEEMEKLIQSTGFYRNKAKNIREACKKIMTDFSGVVPETIEQLVSLPGVGRKTANVILGNAFDKPAGVVVDTHVKRLCFRLGLTKELNPEKVEVDLNRKIPQKFWVMLPHWLIQHGRAVCIARSPKCEICVLNDICPKNGLKTLKASQSRVNRPKTKPRSRL